MVYSCDGSCTFKRVRTYQSQQHLKEHLREHHGVPKLTCPVCKIWKTVNEERFKIHAYGHGLKDSDIANEYKVSNDAYEAYIHSRPTASQSGHTSLPMLSDKKVLLPINIQKSDEKVLEPTKGTIEFFRLIDNNPKIKAIFKKKKISNIDDFIKQLEQSEINEQNAKHFQVMSEQLEELFTTGKHSDFLIKVGDKEYRAHKCVVAPQSSVFDKMITDNPGVAMKSFDNTKNYSPQAIEEFIRYFYVKAEPSPDNVVELMSLAVEFDVPQLKLQCQTAMSKTIDSKSARKIFNLAVQHSLGDLKRAAFEVIKKCHPEIPDYLFNKPEIVDANLAAKEKFQSEVEKEAPEAKRIKLEKEE